MYSVFLWVISCQGTLMSPPPTALEGWGKRQLGYKIKSVGWFQEIWTSILRRKFVKDQFERYWVG